MAFTVKTLADLKQSLADRHDAGVLPTDTATLNYWIRLLNRAKDYCADRIKLTKSTSLTTVSGVIALPDDFIILNKVMDSGGNIIPIISKEDSPFVGTISAWVTGDQDSRFSLNVYGTPNETFTVYYTWRPEDMDADADECVIPDPEAVVAFAYANLRMSETDPLGDADKSFAECERRLNEMEYQRNINDGPQGFTLQANA